MIPFQGSNWGLIVQHFSAEGLRSDRLIGTIVVGLLILVLFAGWFGNKRPQPPAGGQQTPNKQDLMAVSSCKNPNCVRCQRYRQVQQQAKTRLPWILQDLKARDPTGAASLHGRIPSAVRCHRRPAKKHAWQNPSVLMVDDLPSQEIVTDSHTAACQYLLNHSTRKSIMRALHSADPTDVSWTVNDSPQGRWEVFHILNQGTWNRSLENMAWNDVISSLQGIPGLMDQCLFGNVMISRIYPGTVIEPHCGPTNIRHRLQLVLEIPVTVRSNRATLWLLLGREKQILWNALDDVFVFDDSYVHSVVYPQERFELDKDVDGQTIEKGTRIVLIADLWHPDLSTFERSLLQQLYPPFPPSNHKTST